MIFLDLIIYTHAKFWICYGMLLPVDHPANSFGAVEKVPWIPEPSTVNNKLKRREGSGSTGTFFD